MRALLLTLAFSLLAVPAVALDDADVADLLLVAWDLDPVDYAAARDVLVQDAAVTDDLLEDLATSHLDVRVRTEAAIVRGWRHEAAAFAAVWTARSVHDRRDVRERFVDEVFFDADAQPAVVERLLFGDDAPKTRAGLAMAMIRVGDEWDDRMLAVLEDSDVLEVRAMAAWSFRHAPADTALAGLARGLADAAPGVRAEAARSAGFRSDGHGVGGALIEVLADPDASVRAAAARSLGYLQFAGAAGPLEAAIADADPEVRLHALRALDRIDPVASKALPSLETLAADPDPKVARVARRILRR